MLWATSLSAISLRVSILSDSNPRVVMLGCGGHARVLQQILLEQGVHLVGYFAPQGADSRLGDVPWLGEDKDAATDADTTVLVNGIGSASRPDVRQAAYIKARERGFHFLSVVDSSAIVLPSAKVREGAQVFAGAIIGVQVVLEENVIVNTGAVVDHDTVIGAHSHVSPGAVLAGDVRVGEATHIGLGARVIQGLRIGTGSTVGAGAVVIRDVPDSAVAVGIPATFRVTASPE
jgi:sugar O-acyltransferase (sialic acid O-acetyltransferase NeuD family)